MRFTLEDGDVSRPGTSLKSYKNSTRKTASNSTKGGIDPHGSRPQAHQREGMRVYFSK